MSTAPNSSRDVYASCIDHDSCKNVLQAAIYAASLTTSGAATKLATLYNASSISVALSIFATAAAGATPANASLVVIGDQGLANVFNAARTQSALAQLGYQCAAGNISSACNLTVVGLDPASSYHIGFLYPGSPAASTSQSDGRAIITVALGTAGTSVPSALFCGAHQC